MDSDGNNRICGNAMNTCSSGMVANSACEEVSGTTMCSANWDLFVSLNEGGNFGDSPMTGTAEFANPHFSVLAHFASNPGLLGLAPKIPSFRSEKGLQEMIQSNRRLAGARIGSTDVASSQLQWQNPETPSPYGKRKRKTGEEKDMQQKDPTEDTLLERPKAEDETKQKYVQNGSSTQDGNGAEPCKENYIHVRAKRGQATNSHSLAERVRRERISERMRLLQDLVPGCNKITGKAMMLDEIINYVQSLQQQVEFLSMKLATVNPELNLDIDRIFSKDILQFPGSDATTPAITSGLSPLHSFPRYPLNSAPGAIPPILPLPQHMWNVELQGALHAGFFPDPSVCTLATDGMLKSEL